MLPASNRGIGMALNMPDVCKTPAPPAPFVPVPYPDLGMNAQAAPFSPFVFVGFVPATNMSSLKVMTSGDEAGAMGGLITGMIKGPGKTTLGNVIVFVTGLPAECLATPTSGNAMNAPVGVQTVPSVSTVTYTYRGETSAPGELDRETAETLRRLAVAEDGHAYVQADWLAEGVARLRINMFSAHADREIFNALRRLGHERIRGLLVDLRGNPGGDADAALRFAAACLPHGTQLLLERDSDGDEEPVCATAEQSYHWPMAVLVDGHSASAAELVAGCLQHHKRATVFGERSYGKASAQRTLRYPDGKLRHTTVAHYLLPDGSPIEGCGVTPDHGATSTQAPAAALELFDGALTANQGTPRVI